MSRFTQFTEDEKRMFAEAIWRRQRCFIAGDKQFNEYGKMLDEILEGIEYPEEDSYIGLIVSIFYFYRGGYETIV